MTLRLNGDNSGFTEIKAADTAGDNSIKLPASNGSANQLLQNGGTAGELQYTSAGGGVHCDSSGRLLIGTNNSYGAFPAKLQIQNNNGFSALFGKFHPSVAAGPDIEFFKGRGGSVADRAAVIDGDQLGHIVFSGDDGGTGRTGASIQVEVEGTPSTAVMPAKLVFSTNGGSAAPTPRMEIGSNGALKLLAGCPGIDFSGIQTNNAGMTSETLDSYEEGTFTPVIIGTTNVGSGTYTVQTGRYTKIGNRVCFTVRVSWSAHTGTGNMYIGGLPFQVNASELVAGSVLADNLTVPAGTIMRALVVQSHTHINLYAEATGGGSVSLVTLDTSGQIFVTGHYTV